jgi:hypothetical protein
MPLPRMMAPRNIPVVFTYPKRKYAKAYAAPTPSSAGRAMTTSDHADR